METTLAPPPAARRTGLYWRVVARVVVVALMLALALFVRLRATALLPADFDEDDYLRAGQIYAQHIVGGDIAGVVNERENYEHPPLTKLLFGAILATTQGPESYATPVIAGKEDTPAAPQVAAQARPLRTFNAIVGALTAGLVALINPLAGLLVALNSWHIKYTSQAMLEALPCFFATLTLLLLRRSQRNGDRCFWLAAATMGLAAAGTYRYGAAGGAALIWIVWRGLKTEPLAPGAIGLEPTLQTLVRSQPWLRVSLLALAWSALALLTFYAANPALWPDPTGRLRESILFNTGFATSAHVRETGFGWAQPLVWLLGAVPWHPGVFPLLLDGIFGLLALFALRRMRQQPAQRQTTAGNEQSATRITHYALYLVALWFVVNLIFLLFWPTKWPQYILALTVPASLLAARWLADWGATIAASWRRWRTRDAASRRAERGAIGWLLPTLVLSALIVVYPLLLQTALAATSFESRHLRDGGVSRLWDLVRLAFEGDLLTRPKDFALLPSQWSAASIIRAWNEPRAGFSFLHLLGNSLTVAGSTMLIALVFGATTAYAFARYRFPGRQRGLFATLVLLTLPPAGLSAPFFILLNDLGLRRSLLSLVIVYSAIATPFAVWTIRNAIQNVPLELEEAAMLEGASRRTIFGRITLPLVAPSAVVAGFIAFTLAWSEFALGWLFISDPDRVTLAMALYSMRGASGISWGLLSATALLVALPILLLFYGLGKYVISGVSLGTANAEE